MAFMVYDVLHSQKHSARRRRALDGLDLFAGAPASELLVVDQCMTEVPIAAGRTLMREGGTARECFVIVDGTFVVTADGEPIATLGAGEIVGELALLERTCRSANVLALTDGTVLAMHTTEFHDLLASTTVVSGRIRAAASRRRRQSLTSSLAKPIVPSACAGASS